MASALLKQVAVFTAVLTLCTLICWSGFAQSQDPPAAQKFDEFADVAADAAQAHLDQFAQQLQQNLTLQGYLVGYRREERLPGSFLRRVYGYREYLVNQRGVQPEQVSVIDGGISSNTSNELWLVPKGARPPTAAAAALDEFHSPIHFDNIWLGVGCVGEYMLPLQEPADALKFFAGALRDNPAAKGFILVHPATRDGLSKAAKLASDSKESIVRQYRIAADRIGTKLERRRRCSEIDLWLAPLNLVDPRTPSVALFFQSQLMAEAEQNQFTISRVEFVGNERIRDNVLRRRIPGLQEGEIFTKAVLRRNLASLSGLRIIKPVVFEDIEAHLNRNEKLIDLGIFVNERRRAR